MYFRLGKLIKVVTDAWVNGEKAIEGCECVDVKCPFCSGTEFGKGYICFGCGAEYVDIDITQGDNFYIK